MTLVLLVRPQDRLADEFYLGLLLVHFGQLNKIRIKLRHNMSALLIHAFLHLVLALRLRSCFLKLPLAVFQDGSQLVLAGRGSHQGFVAAG